MLKSIVILVKIIGLEYVIGLQSRLIGPKKNKGLDFGQNNFDRLNRKHDNHKISKPSILPLFRSGKRDNRWTNGGVKGSDRIDGEPTEFQTMPKQRRRETPIPIAKRR